MSDEYETEPFPGLPEYLPAGEAILWQGSPVWTSVLRHVYHVVPVAIYFAGLIVWRLTAAYTGGFDLATEVTSVLWISMVGAACIALLVLLARLTTRTTIYTITSKRLVLRYGIAMPICVNLPYSTITSAALQIHPDGTGDLAVTPNGDGHLAYFHLWPHALPWHVNQTKPMMRSLAEPAMVANLLSKTLIDVHPSADRSLAQQADATADVGFGGIGSAAGAV